MSWLSDIGDTLTSGVTGLWDGVTNGFSSVTGLFSGKTGSILGGLVSTAITGFALKKIMDSINNSNQASAASTATTTAPPPPDTGQNIQADANPQNKVPVVYGTAYVGGLLTEAVMSSDAKTMYYVFTLCEQTGTKLSDDLASAISFEEIYYNDQRIVFNSDGVTAQYTLDRGSNEDPSIAGLVQVYCYSGSTAAADQVEPTGYTILPVTTYSIVPGWDSSKTMSDLVFAVVKVSYNRDKGTTGMPRMTFKLQNTMTLPGDCMYDYMTNARYGAGIPVEDIYSE